MAEELRQRRSPSLRVSSEAEKVEAALRFVSPEARETWVQMAFAVKSGLGDEGFEIWDAWSRGSSRYSEAAAREVWRSARGEGRTLASLYWEAKKQGFDPRSYAVAGGAQSSTPVRTAPSASQIIPPVTRKLPGRLDPVQRQAARRAHAVLRAAGVSPITHPYLERKGLSGFCAEMNVSALAPLIGYRPRQNGEYLEGRVLVVPVGNAAGLTTIEMIDEAGRKAALAGGRKSGCWSMVSERPNDRSLAGTGPIYVVEGWATGKSVKAVMPEAAVVAALSCTNLANVTWALQQAHPGRPIVVGADLGQVPAAEAAARAVNGYVVVPAFRGVVNTSVSAHDKSRTDFNDLQQVLTAEVGPQAALGALKKILGDWRRPSALDGPSTHTAHEAITNWGAHGFPSTPGVVAGNVVNHDRSVKMNTATANGQGATEHKERTGKPQVGALILKAAEVPQEIRDLATTQFGARTEVFYPREHGGPYRGEVYNTERYLIQEVGSRSVVIHDKAKLEHVSDQLKWMDENKRMNGAEVQIHYGESTGKIYPYDRQREALERAVGSLKKSAKELGLPEQAAILDKLQEKSWSRVKAARQAQIDNKQPAKEARAPAR